MNFNWKRTDLLPPLVCHLLGLVIAALSISSAADRVGVQIFGVDEAVIMESVEKKGFFAGYDTEFILNATMERHKMVAPYALPMGPGFVRTNRGATSFQPSDKLLLLSPFAFFFIGLALMLGSVTLIPSDLKSLVAESVELACKRTAAKLALASLAFYALYVLNVRLFH